MRFKISPLLILFLFFIVSPNLFVRGQVLDSAIADAFVVEEGHVDTVDIKVLLDEYRGERHPPPKNLTYIESLNDVAPRLLLRNLDRKDSLNLRKLFCYLGLDYRDGFNDIDRAIANFKQSSALGQAASSRTLAQYIEVKLGDLYAMQGQYESAILIYNEALSNFEAINNISELIKCQKSLGDAYGYLMDTTQQLRYYTSALENMLGQKVPVSTRLSVFQSLAKYYFDRDKSKFHQFQNQAKILLPQNSVNDQKYYNRLAVNEELQGKEAKFNQNTSKALQHFIRQREYLIQGSDAKIDRFTAKSSIQIAEIFRMRGAFDSCRTNIKTAYIQCIPDFNKEKNIVESDQFFAENTIQEILLEQAKYYKSLYVGKQTSFLDSALICVNRGIQIQEILDNDVNQLGSLLQSSSSYRSLIDFGIEILSIYPDKEKSQDELDRFIASSKNRILTFNSQQRTIYSELPNSLKRKVSTWKKKIVHLKFDPETMESHHALLYQDSIQNILNVTSNSGVKNEITEHDFLDYYMTEHAVYLSVGIDDSKQVIRLGNKNELIQMLDTMNVYLEAKLPIQKASAKLYSFLIPIEVSLPSKFIVIPDGELSNLSFDLLYNEGKYLIEDHEIHYQYNRLETSRPQVEKSPINIVAIAPDYRKAGYTEISEKRGDLGILPNAQKEVNELQRIFDNNSSVASSSFFVENIEKLNNYNLLHFAGHAFSASHKSYLALVIDSVIVKFQNSQIYNLPHNFDHITLSACETGLGSFINGEAIMSLGSNFLQSGAKSIAYSLWNSNDQSSQKIMTNFYENLSSGSSKSTSLHNAKLSFYKNASPTFKHPYYWANFVFVGENASLKVPSNSLSLSTILLCSAIVLTLLLIFLKSKTS